MSEIFSKLFVRKQDAEVTEYELQLSDLPFDSEAEQDIDAIFQPQGR